MVLVSAMPLPADSPAGIEPVSPVLCSGLEAISVSGWFSVFFPELKLSFPCACGKIDRIFPRIVMQAVRNR